MERKEMKTLEGKGFGTVRYMSGSTKRNIHTDNAERGAMTLDGCKALPETNTGKFLKRLMELPVHGGKCKEELKEQ